MALVSVLVLLPPVQRKMVYWAKSLGSRALGAEIALESVDLDLPRFVVFKGVSLYDRQNVAMFRVEELRLEAFSISLWDFLFHPKQSHHISLGKIVLGRPYAHLYVQQRDSVLNLNRVFPQDTNATAPATSLYVDIQALEIKEGRFLYLDSSYVDWAVANTGDLNYAHFDMGEIFGSARLTVDPLGKLFASVRGLSLNEICSGFRIDEANMDLRLDTLSPATGTPMRILSLDSVMIRSGKSMIQGHANFPQGTFATLFDDLGTDKFTAHLSPSVIDFSTLNFFVPDTLPLYGSVHFSGDLNGQFRHFFSDNFEASVGNNSFLKGTLDLESLGDPDAARLLIRLNNTQISFADLSNLIPSAALPDYLLDMSPIQLQGSYEGGYTDFMARASLIGDAGEADFSLHLVFAEDAPLSYEGSFATRALNLRKLKMERGFPSGRLNARGKILGKGLSLDELDTKLDIQITQSELFGFDIDSVYAVVFAKQKKISGALSTRDSTGRASLRMDLDFSKSPASYILDGKIANLNLYRYQLYNDKIAFSSQIYLNMQGDSLDQIKGRVELDRMVLENLDDGRKISLPSLNLVAQNDGNANKHYSVESELFNVDLGGVFRLQQASTLITRLAKETRLYFSNNDSLIKEYYAGKVAINQGVSIGVKITTGDSLSSLMEFLEIPVYVGEGSAITCGLNFQEFDEASVSFEWDTLKVYGVGFTHGVTDVELFKQSTENRLLVTGGLHAERVMPTDKLTLTNVSFDFQGTENTFESDFKAGQLNTDNSLKLRFFTTFLPGGSIEAQFDSSATSLYFNKETLYINNDNRFLYDQTDFRVEHLLLQSGDRFLRLDGWVSQDPKKSLNVELSSLNLNVVNDIADIDYDLQGIIHANLDLYELLDNPRMTGYSRIDEFTLNDFAYGNMYLTTNWNQASQSLFLKADLVNDRDTTITLVGNYVFSDEKSPLKFNLRSDQGFPLNYIEPFVESQLYGIKGQVVLDRFSITGTLEDMKVNGTGELKDCSFGVDYLKTRYTFNGLIQFDKNQILLPQISVVDQESHRANLYGSIRHRGLQEFTFDLQMDGMNNFLFMDTQKGDNDYFYGKVYLKDGVASVTGDLNRLNIQAFVTTGQKTVFRIPLMDYSTNAETPEFIVFKGKENDSTLKAQTGTSGFELNLTVVATNDALIELIFDDRVGDIIRGRGEGAITFKVTAEGDFTMYGDYEISQGDYLFTSQNVINKKFDVKPGGHISWSGDPYDAQIKVEAIYSINADIKDLLSPSSPSLRVPVNVLMKLEGQLMQPQINLSIEIPNLNNQAASQIVSSLRSIQYDEQELNKQVFSLIVFNRFAPIGSGLGSDQSVGSGVATSVSELLSNQLNYWLGQSISDKVNVNVGTSNFQDVNLLLSAKLFNDRVTVERNGTLVGQNTPFSLGNISITIKLLPKVGQDANLAYPRELVLEVFNRENLSDNFLRDNRTGVGIFYKIDFDNLYDLLRKESRKDIVK